MKFKCFVENETILYCDNQSAIALCKNSVHHACSKHIDISYFRVKHKKETKLKLNI